MSQSVPSYLQNDDLSFASKAIRVGNNPKENKNKEIVSPLSLSTIYIKEMPQQEDNGFHYIRCGSPSVTYFEECLASLEGTKYCLVFSSGHAAASNIISLLRSGNHVIVQKDLYHGNYSLFKELQNRNIAVDFVDATLPKNVEKAVRSSTVLIWLETPTNPLLKLVDLKEINSLAKSKNSNVITVCDNTFMTPYFQRPAAFGIDIVMHSCTKYIGGHSDLLMGAVCTSRKDLYDSLKNRQVTHGAVASPFDCFLASRSLKTLEVRMERHMKNGLKIAEFLEQHAAVEKVLHPGLASHPQHKLSLRQCFGHSGMLSFYLKGHDLNVSRTFVKNLKFIYYAGSLGAVDTTIIMSMDIQGDLSEKEMISHGITKGLFRISVGIESVQDIINDLKRGLDAVVEEGLINSFNKM